MPDMTLLDASINNISLEGTSLRDQVENIVELGNVQFLLTPMLCRQLCDFLLTPPHGR